VISNGQAAQQRSKLERTGILDRFDRVLISEECGCAKPNAAIFHRACSMVDESPQQSVYVGDLYDVDAVAARAAGLTGIWLDRAEGCLRNMLLP
jgi:putative hydrolase of the HAD superfamily